MFGHQPTVTKIVSNITPRTMIGLAYGFMFFSAFGIGSLSTTVTGYLADRYNITTAFWLNMGIAFMLFLVSIAIYNRFASTMGFKWLGSIAIGGGEIYQGSRGKLLDDLGKFAEKMKSLLEEVAHKLFSGAEIGDLVPNFFPKLMNVRLIQKFLVKMNNRGWKKRAEQNGGFVDAKPYLEQIQ